MIYALTDPLVTALAIVVVTAIIGCVVGLCSWMLTKMVAITSLVTSLQTTAEDNRRRVDGLENRLGYYDRRDQSPHHT